MNRTTLALLLVALIGAWHTRSEVRAQFAWAEDRAAHIRRVDQFYLNRVPEGNVFIKFKALDGIRDGVFIYEQYVRATYALHPRKVYISPDPEQLPHATSIVEANVIPSDDWLRQHGVQTVITFDASHGAPQVHFRDLAP